MMRLRKAHLSKDRDTGTLGMLASLPAPPHRFSPLHPAALASRLPHATPPPRIPEPQRLLWGSAATFRLHVVLPPVQPCGGGAPAASSLEGTSSRVSASVPPLVEPLEGGNDLSITKI